MIKTEIVVPGSHIICEKLKARISQVECEWRQKQGGVEYYVCHVCKGLKYKGCDNKKYGRYYGLKKKPGPKKQEKHEKTCIKCDKTGYIIIRKGLCDSCYKKSRRKKIVE